MFPEQRYPGQTRVFYADVRENYTSWVLAVGSGHLSSLLMVGAWHIHPAAPTCHTQWPLQALQCGEADREVRKMPRLWIRLYNLG